MHKGTILVVKYGDMNNNHTLKIACRDMQLPNNKKELQTFKV